MKTLKELTEKIAQLQNEMNPAAQVSSAKPNHNQSKTKTDVRLGPFKPEYTISSLQIYFETDHFSFCMICDQAQKELLDAELDFHKKMSSGEDTTDLKRKLGQLQVEVMHTHKHTNSS